MKKIIFIKSAILLLALPLSASDKFSVALTATTEQEVQVEANYSMFFPVFQGNSFLTEDNNLEVKISGSLSPVSVKANADLVLTPIAFLKVMAGGSVGTGWNIPLADGLRKNHRVNGNDSEFVGDNFDGVVYSVKGGGLFQFDLAAVLPGDWNHVVFQTMHLGIYRALSSAAKDESWLFEADHGQNRNGWIYYGNYFFGYQPPLNLSMVGILVEEEEFLYTTKNRDLWGDDLSSWTIGGLVNYDITKSFGFSFLTQWASKRTYTDETKDFGFYQDKRIADRKKIDFEFYRFVATATWNLK